MTECPRCGRELDPLLMPECECLPGIASTALDEPVLYPTALIYDAGVRRFVDEVLDELEDDE